jgi:hypothetical protein
MDLLFFTDSSKSTEEEFCHTGSAFVAFQGTSFHLPPLLTQHLRVSSTISNNEAEAWAVASAICFIYLSLHLSRSIPPFPNELWSETFLDVNFDIHQFAAQISINVSSFMSNFTCHIYTDSQICLSALQNPKVSSNSHIFCFIHNVINSNSHSISPSLDSLSSWSSQK